MKTSITILCNSPQCLAEISAGNYPGLEQSDLFTCNLAYSFFRTTGRHLNIFSDRSAIIDFLTNDFKGVYSVSPYNKVEFVFHSFEFKNELLMDIASGNITGSLKLSGVNAPGSSAINALLHLSEHENYDLINLVGYTLNEWDGIQNVKELKSKVEAFGALNKRYKQVFVRDCVYRYELRG